jgi:hypothetical protein
MRPARNTAARAQHTASLLDQQVRRIDSDVS